MKQLLYLLLLFSYSSFGQSARSVTADLGVSTPYLTDYSGNAVSSQAIGINHQGILLKVNINNYQSTASVPSRSSQLIIGLGDKMILDPSLNLSAAAPLSAYYSWSIGMSSGQQQITGTLKMPLPAGFSGTVIFAIKALREGSSFISAQHASSNLDPLNNLNDPNNSNNSGALSYTIGKPQPLSTDNSVWVLSVYPNPVTDLNYITIAVREGVFNGSYKLELYDNSGRLYQRKELSLSNVKTVRYNFDNKLGAGQYTIRVINTDGTQSAALKFEKL